MVSATLYTTISVAATAICVANAYAATREGDMPLAGILAYLLQSKLYVLVRPDRSLLRKLSKPTRLSC